jgi:hypothetical protein
MATDRTASRSGWRSRGKRWIVVAAKGVFVAVWGFGWLVGAVFTGAGLLAQGQGLPSLAAVLFAVAIGVFVLWALSMGVWP